MDLEDLRLRIYTSLVATGRVPDATVLTSELGVSDGEF